MLMTKELDQEYLIKIEKRSEIKWLAHAIGNWFVILITMFFAIRINHPAIYVIGVFIIGTRQHGIAGLGHDGGHCLVSNNKKLNDFLTNLFVFWPLAMDLSAYRLFHFEHHKTVGTAVDPELKHKSWSNPAFDLPAKKLSTVKYLFKDLVGLSAKELIYLMKLTMPENKFKLIRIIVPLIIFQAIIVLLGYWQYIALWNISLGTSFWAMFRIRIWLEHMGTTGTHRVHLPKLVELIVAPSGFMYHWEHHKYMNVPFYNLKYARKEDDSEKIIPIKELRSFYEKSNTIPSGSISVT